MWVSVSLPIDSIIPIKSTNVVDFHSFGILDL